MSRSQQSSPRNPPTTPRSLRNFRRIPQEAARSNCDTAVATGAASPWVGAKPLRSPRSGVGEGSPWWFIPLGRPHLLCVAACLLVFALGVSTAVGFTRFLPSLLRRNRTPQASGRDLQAPIGQQQLLLELQSQLEQLQLLNQRHEWNQQGTVDGEHAYSSPEEVKLLQTLQRQLTELQRLDGAEDINATAEDEGRGNPTEPPCVSERALLVGKPVTMEPSTTTGSTSGETCPPCPVTATTTAAPMCPSCPCFPVKSEEPEQSSWAFVMMAHDEPGSHSHLLGVVAMARALQRMSAYPLVVLTNATEFPDGTSVAEGFASLHVQVLPLYPVQMPQHLKVGFMYSHWEIAWWKLQIWNLTQFEKLIWLDSDAILYRSIDWLFDRPWMWAQRDDWFCEMKVPKVCSGIMLLYPDQADFTGLLEYADTLKDLSDGDQQLISMYFKNIRHKPINLLNDLEASFGHCIGKAPSPYVNPDDTLVWGIWDTPTFVHKSGGFQNTNDDYSNICFSYKIHHQLFRVGDETLNMCHFHPLGAWWRMLFCEAVNRVGLRLPEVDSYCNDECWYQGKTPEFDGAQTCGPVSTTINYANYEAQKPAQPFDAE